MNSAYVDRLDNSVSPRKSIHIDDGKIAAPRITDPIALLTQQNPSASLHVDA
jgi:hypothetical protein